MAISSSIIAGSKRTRSPSTLAPAFFSMSRACGSVKSMPISESTFSEARWIDSSSSAETISIGGNRRFSLRRGSCGTALRPPPPPRRPPPSRRGCGGSVLEYRCCVTC